MSNRTEEISISIPARHSTHITRVFYDLMSGGWKLSRFPSNGLSRNCQLFELQAPQRAVRFRVSAYKVSGRGEAHRLHQQRIEITTTIGSGLAQLRNWGDVVLGYDPATDVYVGLDPRRIALGGETHNASSSVDPAALALASSSAVLVRPHRTRAFGLEYQAMFKPPRLSEYLFNQEQIHSGQYRGSGPFSGKLRSTSVIRNATLPADAFQGAHVAFSFTSNTPTKSRIISTALVEASEKEDLSELTDLTPEDLELVLQKRREVGEAGESFVYDYERKRLNKAGKRDLAARIQWISRRAVGRGYDIESFEVDGRPRFIEVKSTIAEGDTFFISGNEWRIATNLRKSYWIYRVTQAMRNPTISRVICDPVGAEALNKLERVIDGWRVTIR